jgi:phage shock protein A
MGLIDRILRVIRANITNLIGKAEDPEKVLEETVLEMQENLIQLRQAVAQAIATQKRTERQYSQAENTASEWYDRAQLALSKGDENLARQALTKRKGYQETAEAMREQIDQQSQMVNRLKQDMRSLEAKISEARTKKDMYIARARSAQASAKINEMIGGVNTTSTMTAFERMEDKVLQLEAQSEAIAELGTDDLQKKFLTLEDAGEIDTELTAMKAQLGQGTQTPQLPSTQSANSDPSLDPELQKIRSQLESS